MLRFRLEYQFDSTGVLVPVLSADSKADGVFLLLYFAYLTGGTARTALCVSVLDLARDGLREQGLGAEAYLEPLYRRAETLCSPARHMVEQLESGIPLNDLILKYAAL